ncbi:probable RNA-directed DNA polymerase from transposon X-element [Trichonephila clavipes]|nr:probable RNA-directed DNA polymerase from transposon X-element [Trichonephila clavipes]
MAYSDFEKAEVFKDTLEVTFQENEEPYCDDKIEEVESLVDDYFDNFATCTPPLTSPPRPAFPTYTFDDYIQWVPVVKYLGLHIDSRLTFKKHIDYLSEKFWVEFLWPSPLVGRRSPLSLENKVILYKQILRPVITYGSPVWGAAAATHMKKVQVMQNKILRVMTNAPWYVRNDVIHNDLQMEPISNYITKLSRNVFKSIEFHENPIIQAQTLFTYPHPKIKYSYSSTKWRNPLRPP